MKEIIKKIIVESQQRNYSEAKSRSLEILFDSGMIVSLIGARRCGKTYLLYNVINKLRLSGVDSENIFYINFEDERLQLETAELDLILQAYMELYPEKQLSDCYFFFDEIQNINGWEAFIRRVFDTISKKIFITGSNSKLLSTEIATSLRGRTISYTVYPLQLREYLDFRNIQIEFYQSQKKAMLINATHDFMCNGGFPEVLNMESNMRVKVLQSYYNTMIYRDIVERYKIADPLLLKYFIKKIISAVGKPLSINKIYNDLHSQGYKVSNNYLYTYEDYCKTIFLTIGISKFDFSEIKQAKYDKKTYCIDTGFISSLEFTLTENYGKLLENMVLLEFLKLDFEAFYYKEKYECDFVVRKANELRAIQVCYSTRDSETMEREIRGLVEACKYLNIKEGIIITFDETQQTIIKNEIIIKVIPVYVYFLKETS